MKPLILIFICFLFFSCRKDVSETHHDFVGKWVAPSGYNNVYYLYIMDDGYSEYIHLGDHEEHKTRGKAIVKNDYLKIGRFKRFKIIQYPQQDSFGQWSMVLGERTFFKDKW